MVGPSSSRVARRFVARTVEVEVLWAETEKARARHSGATIGRFLSPMPLFRVFDGEELRDILSTGEIKGGDYSVRSERAYGAQWGSDLDTVARWGEGQRGQRLGHELFVAEIEGQGRVFSHLGGANGAMSGPGVVHLDPGFCSMNLGCSVHATVQSVVAWYVVEDGKPRRVPLAELEALQDKVGLRPREVSLFKGAPLEHLPPRLAKALRFEVFAAGEGRELDVVQRIRRMRDLGIADRDAMDREKLGKALVQAVCDASGFPTLWGTSLSRAESSAGRTDGERRFAVIVSLVATVAVPHREVDIADLSGVAVRYVDLELPTSRGWPHRVWQPLGKIAVRLSPEGKATFRAR